jgi:hypothetical protein
VTRKHDTLAIFAALMYGTLLLVTTMTTDSKQMNAPDSLKKNLEWYIANQKTLAEKYNGKVLLIVDQKLIGAFADMGTAYTDALKTYALGTFTLQPCSADSDSYTLTLYSPMHSFLA